MHISVSVRSMVAAVLLPVSLIAAWSTHAIEPTASSSWRQFRGENGIASVSTCNVPLPWTDTDVAWSRELPGKGNSSPIVAGNQIFLMSADADSAERYVLAYDLASGEEKWRKNYPSVPHHLHARSSYASCTPCANDQAMFTAWAAPESLILKAFDHAGNELWTRDDLGRFVSQHGFGASPVLFGDRLVLFNSQASEQLPPGVEPGQSRVMCFDAASGKTLWDTPLTTTRVCYGVPRRFTDVSGKEALLFCNTGDGLFALELETGKPLWNRSMLTKRSVSSPVIVGDLAFCSEGSGGGGNILFAVDLKGEHEIVFKVDRAAPYVPTPVAKDDLLFLWSDDGIVSCIKLPENKVLWKERVGGNVSSSPLIAGDKLLGIAEDGTLTVLAASAEFKEFGTVKLEDTVRATPLLHEDYVLIRTDSKLICVGKPKTE
ncbi:MAG: PQQ-binding-like beta-propeller repeat protein [Pirellulaceae bacterium]